MRTRTSAGPPGFAAGQEAIAVVAPDHLPSEETQHPNLQRIEIAQREQPEEFGEHPIAADEYACGEGRKKAGEEDRKKNR